MSGTGRQKHSNKSGGQRKLITDKAYYYIALEDWDAITKMGKSAIGPLIDMLKDEHPAIRIRIIEILGSTGDAEARKFL